MLACCDVPAGLLFEGKKKVQAVVLILVLCLRLHSYGAARLGGCFSACQRACICIFLHARHAAGVGAGVWVGELGF